VKHSASEQPAGDRTETLERFVRATAGGLVVSCQALPEEPLYGPEFMAAMARAAVLGGARAVRVNGPADVAAVRAAVDVPVVGLWKDGHEGVYITPTVRHALAVADAGADVVAIDATGRPRGDGLGLAATVRELHAAGIVVLADVSTREEGLAAVAAGADLVASTLSGYTPASSVQDGPDLELVERLAGTVAVPVIAEGRVGTPAEAAAALARGAHAVVVGGAITRPSDITARFAAALGQAGHEAAAPSRWDPLGTVPPPSHPRPARRAGTGGDQVPVRPPVPTADAPRTRTAS
jgi:putative N-acetylmannosamine-6-phosphate epimerase